MADANQLKIQARRQEAAGDYEQASRLYLEALSAMDEGGNLSDPSLLVRVADLEYRQDDADSALEYYLQAVDEYAEQGLITNAIAVCNKILRVFPDQVDCHRRLADLHMDVGLTAEARQNLLRFADEAWDPDDPEPVVEAMQTFLGRTPDQDVALRLASHLEEVGRQDEAVDALKAVWEERIEDGGDVEALKQKAREIRSDARPEDWSSPEAADEDGDEDDAEVDVGAGGDAGDGREAAERPAARAGEGRPGDASPGEDEAVGRPDDVGVQAGRPEDADVELEPEAVPEPGAGNGREPWDDALAELPALSERAAAGEERHAAAPEPEVELMASYRDRFTQVRRSLAGRRSGSAPGGPAGPNGDEGPGDTATAEPARPAGRPDGAEERDEAPAGEPGDGAARPAAEGSPGTRGRPSGDEAARQQAQDAPLPDTAPPDAHAPDTREEPPEAGAREAHDGRRPAAETQEPADAADRSAADSQSEVQRKRDEIMEELNELDRASDVSTADGGWGAEEPEEPADRAEPGQSGRRGGGEAEGPSASDAGPAGPDPAASGGDELGEEAELRRGMELVDEMLEVQPDNLDLRERKLRYARRLDDREALVDASLDLADALAKKDARRSARALYRRVLELDPENQAAESGLARLDVGELEEKRQAGKRAGSASTTPKATSPDEQEARRELGMRLWTEFENSIREMPWLHAATQAYQAAGPDALPPLETFEMLAHYLMARGRYADAAGILERALELTDDGDEQMSDVLYYLGRAYEEMDEDERADAYFDRLERVDPDFARVREALPDPERA